MTRVTTMRHELAAAVDRYWRTDTNLTRSHAPSPPCAPPSVHPRLRWEEFWVDAEVDVPPSELEDLGWQDKYNYCDVVGGRAGAGRGEPHERAS